MPACSTGLAGQQQAHVRIATRGSPLALVQAQQAADLLEHELRGRHPSPQLLQAATKPELVTIFSRGDMAAAAALSMRQLGPGAFTEELDAAVQSGRGCNSIAVNLLAGMAYAH